MTREELLNKAINWFKVIAEDMSRITSGNLSHNTKTTQGRAIRACEFVEKHKNECFDEWHKESEESIYLSIMDWSIHRFVCLMKDNTIQVFSGIRDENYDGAIATHIYNIGDEVWMMLFGKPEEFVITGIEYTHHRIFIGCKYYIKSTDCEYEVAIPEGLLFPTKEELLKGL